MVFPSQWQARRARLLGSVALLLSLLATAPGCTRDASSSSGQDAKVNVVATVGFLGDVAREIGGDRVEVDSLMGPGVDPHLYKPTEQDIQRLTGADLILFVGLNLEGKMSDLFVKLARRGRHAFAVTEDLDTARLREPPELAGHYDPHIWFDVSLWQEAVRGTTRALTEVDPAGKDHYEARASAYLQRLEALHVSVKERIAQIPKERRVLVTSHDAFGYFGRAYDIDVIGLQGISTVNEAGLGDVKRIK
ncbi:MAG: metal ABC transporter solute-binding protein, Zn/Mn family, partial [Planctomycetota bacterium]